MIVLDLGLVLGSTVAIFDCVFVIETYVFVLYKQSSLHLYWPTVDIHEQTVMRIATKKTCSENINQYLPAGTASPSAWNNVESPRR